MIVFSEKDHKYTHLESGNKLMGWTSLIKMYTQPFDKESQLICSAYKILLGEEEYNKIVKGKFGKLYDLNQKEVSEFLSSSVNQDVSSIVDEIAYEWEYSAINGSIFHKMFENKAISLGYEINPFTEKKVKTIVLPKKYDNQSLSDNLFDLEDGFYPELLVWDNTMGQDKSVVTQIDRAFIQTVGKKRYVDVDDVKSNANKPYESKSKFMLSPLGGVYDNTVEKYKMQVLFGGKLLSTFGFTPRHFGFTHYTNYDVNKSKMYLAKYDSGLMDRFQESWKDKLLSKGV